MSPEWVLILLLVAWVLHLKSTLWFFQRSFRQRYQQEHERAEHWFQMWCMEKDLIREILLSRMGRLAERKKGTEIWH